MNTTQRWHNAHAGHKPKVMRVTDPAMIASIERNGHGDLIGWSDCSGWWAYAFSVERWRSAQRTNP